MILYILALFLNKYLCINWLKLGPKKLDLLEKLKELILSNNIVQLDRNID